MIEYRLAFALDILQVGIGKSTRTKSETVESDACTWLRSSAGSDEDGGARSQANGRKAEEARIGKRTKEANEGANFREEN